MKVGDLVKWAYPDRDDDVQLGLVLDKIEHHIKVAELSKKRLGDTDWWEFNSWTLVKEKKQESP